MLPLTDEVITRGNNSIATFMDLVYRPACGRYSKPQYWKHNGKRLKFHAYFDSLTYHEDWNELMPVIEKLCKTKTGWSTEGDIDTYYPRTFGMIGEAGEFMVRINRNILNFGDTLKEAAWIAIVDFLDSDILA